jgi:hypothetical protein
MNAYLKYTPYLYLLIAIACLYKGFINLNNPDGHSVMSFVFAGVAIFMFFFRKIYAKKFMDRSNKN